MRYLIAFLLVSTAAAKDFAPRDNVDIVALDAQTGRLLWRHAAGIGNAHYELYDNLLVAYPHYDQRDRSKPIFLVPATGAAARDTRSGTPVARSWAQFPDAPIVLDNGWALTGFRSGYTKDLAFAAGGATTWTVHPAEYPEQVLAYKNLAMYAYGSTHQAMLFAQVAGAARPAWSIDFNAVLHESTRRSRVAMQIVDGDLFAQVGPHVFKIQPATGAMDWHVDTSVATKLAYEPELYGGALDIAVFARAKGSAPGGAASAGARDDDVLVVAFEKRVIALDARTGKLLWHVSPDTFPNTPFPLARDGRVYLTAGAKLTAP